MLRGLKAPPAALAALDTTTPPGLYAVGAMVQVGLHGNHWCGFLGPEPAAPDLFRNPPLLIIDPARGNADAAERTYSAPGGVVHLAA